MGQLNPSRIDGRSGSCCGYFVRKWFLSDHFVLYLCVVFFIVQTIAYPGTVQTRSLQNLMSNMWPLLTLVLGQMFVLMTGGIDLSQTAVMAITSVLGALVITGRLDPALFDRNPLWGSVLTEEGGLLGGHILATPVGALVMVGAGSLIGLCNGLCVARLRMPPFMVTLVTLFFFNGLARYVTRSENIMALPSAFIALGKGGTGPLTIPMIIVVLLCLGAWFLLARTVWGRWLVATGMNRKAAAISGVPVSRVIVLAYTLSGFCAGAGSILYSARLEMGRPTLGQNMLLDVIGAAVIGGISLYGGKGKVLWAVYGVLFFGLLTQALNRMDLPFYTISIVKGGVILMAALLDALRTRILARQGIGGGAL